MCVETKICAKCKKIKPENKDYFVLKKKDGDKFHASCKECRSIYNKKRRKRDGIVERETNLNKIWRKNNREKVLKSHKERKIRNLKKFIISIYYFIFTNEINYLLIRINHRAREKNSARRSRRKYRKTNQYAIEYYKNYNRTYGRKNPKATAKLYFTKLKIKKENIPEKLLEYKMKHILLKRALKSSQST